MDYTHPINSLYLSKDPTSPAQLFGGVWEQLTADAYFKIVSSNGGVLGGTSAEHKIPVESMPSHAHSLGISEGIWAYGVNASMIGNGVYANGWAYHANITNTLATGGGQPYYPYYYGVYAWIRVE